MKSIRQHLLLLMLVGLTASIVVAAFTVYERARSEARDLFDYQLQLVAAAFPNQGFGIPIAPSLDGAEREIAMVVEIWDQNGVEIYASRPGLPVPHSVVIGFSTVTTQQGDWRVYSAIIGNNVVQVSQPISLQEQLAASLALRTILPLLVLLPVLFALTWGTVGRGLKPLTAVTAAVGNRSAGALEPLSENNLPAEVKPLVNALNDLLARLSRALSVQRSFIADAAHELRTPLTAVTLQLQMAERASTDMERRNAFVELKGGIERTTRLVGQLLSLAHQEPDAAERPFSTINLTAIARQVVAERAQIADAKHLDLGFSADVPLPIMGNAESVQVLIGNLVDNALHYTLAGGRVDVGVSERDAQACLIVTDTGPGIPVEERARVFDRFYRGAAENIPGSGLGLAIVSKIAQRHHATISLDSGTGGRGLQVTALFPLSTEFALDPVGQTPDQ